jgi:formylglycine-generating enzyme required for sulfatase activity
MTFEMTKYEITNYQYSIFLNMVKCSSDGFYNHPEYGNIRLVNPGARGSGIKFENGLFKPADGDEEKPVTAVNWYSAMTFCNTLDFRLPTEAEWEYAARGGAEGVDLPTQYSGSDAAADVAWYYQTTDELMPVGFKQPNSLGIYDMSGNAWEWVSDWYQADYYDISPSTNPTGPEAGEEKVIRGGCYTSQYVGVRVANRYKETPLSTNSVIGFRVVRD